MKNCLFCDKDIRKHYSLKVVLFRSKVLCVVQVGGDTNDVPG